MKKVNIVPATAIAVLSVLMFPAAAFAHVVVTPSQVGIGASSLFDVSVPNEKEVAVTSIKLAIPKGVQDVSPDASAGWDIVTEGPAGNVTAITWTGTIPVGQRADFTFKAQAPAQAGSLDWRAYQTYADGSVVQWDQDPAGNGKSVKGDIGPYSVTKVVDDLSTSATAATGSNTATLALVFSIAALVISAAGLFLRRK